MPLAASPPRRRLARALVCGLACAAVPALRASDVEQAEYRIKAAFLCKFGNYVEWPGRPPGGVGEAFGVGVLAAAPVVDELRAAAQGQTVHGQPIAVRRLERGAAFDGVAIVFVARSHADQLARVQAAVAQRPVLLVTESERGVPPGSMVNFVVVDDKVRSDIALEPAQRSSLKISARLLGVARHISGGTS